MRALYGIGVHVSLVSVEWQIQMQAVEGESSRDISAKARMDMYLEPPWLDSMTWQARRPGLSPSISCKQTLFRYNLSAHESFHFSRGCSIMWKLHFNHSVSMQHTLSVSPDQEHSEFSAIFARVRLQPTALTTVIQLLLGVTRKNT